MLLRIGKVPLGEALLGTGEAGEGRMGSGEETAGRGEGTGVLRESRSSGGEDGGEGGLGASPNSDTTLIGEGLKGRERERAEKRSTNERAGARLGPFCSFCFQCAEMPREIRRAVIGRDYSFEDLR